MSSSLPKSGPQKKSDIVSTAPKAKQFVETSTVLKGQAIHQRRLQRERSRAKRTAFLINFVLSFYFLFSIYYLSLVIQGEGFSDQRILVVVAILGLGLSAIWTRLPESPGMLLVYRTNKLLKSLPTHALRPMALSFSKWFGAAMILITIALGVVITKFDLRALFSESGLEGANRIFSSLLRPELSIINLVLASMIQTIFIALMATGLAIPIAFVASFFCARNLMKGSLVRESVYNFLRFIFNFSRSVEPLIWAIIFSVWVGIGPFAGMLALMIHSIASLAKLYSEQIESIDNGPVEAIEATGANRVQVVWYAVVPQIVLPYLAFTIYRWDINIRMATIIGLVGGGGIGTLFMQYQGLARWNEVGTIIITIAIVVWIMDYLSAKLREAIY